MTTPTGPTATYDAVANLVTIGLNCGEYYSQHQITNLIASAAPGMPAVGNNQILHMTSLTMRNVSSPYGYDPGSRPAEDRMHRTIDGMHFNNDGVWGRPMRPATYKIQARMAVSEIRPTGRGAVQAYAPVTTVDLVVHGVASDESSLWLHHDHGPDHNHMQDTGSPESAAIARLRSDLTALDARIVALEASGA